MRQADTENLGQSKMAVECAAHLAVAAAWLASAPYTPLNYSPAEMAIHTVNHAIRAGKLGFMHRALTEHLH